MAGRCRQGFKGSIAHRTKMIAGIYEIKSPSGGRYIGSSVNIASRWRQHRSDLKLGKHRARALQRAYVKYHGQLVFRMMFVCDPTLCLFYEERALMALKPRYNSTSVSPSMLGFKHTDESRRRMSISASKRRATMETRLNMGIAQSARRKTEIGMAQLRRMVVLAHSERDVTCELCGTAFMSTSSVTRFCKSALCNANVRRRITRIIERDRQNGTLPPQY